MEKDEMRRRVARARVARLGTVDEHGRAHVVPVTFVLEGDTIYSPTDAGPRPVKRLRNLEADPRVSVLVDAYDEDWSKVWWVRMGGTGRVVKEGWEYAQARKLLDEKYPQFETAPAEEVTGPMMAVDIEQWSGWAYSGSTAPDPQGR